MLDKIYYRFIRKLITNNDEKNQYSGGLWPRLTRETAAALYSNVNGKMIELGCGEGLFIELLSKTNPESEIYGIDFRQEIIEVAKSRLLARYSNIKLYSGNALTTQLENQKFDFTYCMNTVLNLESIAEVESLFKEANRITVKGGKFIFDIRNSLSPIIQLQYRLVKFYDTGITVPLRSYMGKTIEKLLFVSGFKIHNKIYVGFPKNCFAPAILYVAEKI